VASGAVLAHFSSFVVLLTCHSSSFPQFITAFNLRRFNFATFGMFPNIELKSAIVGCAATQIFVMNTRVLETKFDITHFCMPHYIK
jgi:hypothetical protein